MRDNPEFIKGTRPIRLKFFIFCLITTIAISFCLILLVPLDLQLNRIQQELWNYGHLFGFGALSFFVFRYVKHFLKTKSQPSVGILVFCCLLVFGAFTEFLQSLVPSRSASMRDMSLNAVGILLGIVLAYEFSSRYSRIVKAGLCLLFLSFSSIPAIPIFYDEMRMRLDFPTLSDFTYTSQISRWKGDKTLTNSDVAGLVLVHNVSNDEYSGMSLVSLVSNWHEYQTLKIELWSDSAGYLTLRVHDRAHKHSRAYNDRFNHKLNVIDGWNSISISLENIKNAPKTRTMKMQEIEELIIFSSAPHSISEFSLAKLWLEK